MPKNLARPGIAAFLPALVLLLPALAAAQAERHRYRIALDPALSRLTVEARLETPAKVISARSRDAGNYLVDARDCEQATPIRLRNQRMMLPLAGIRCMNYTVDLAAAAAAGTHNRALAADNVLVSPSLWLWRPQLTAGSELHIRFELPAGVRVALPWPQLDDAGLEYRLAASPQSADAPAVFGRFEYAEVAVPGATLRVSLLRAKDGGGPARQTVTRWLQATATDVSLAYGRFPNPSPQVVVSPAPAERGRAVTYGRVIRDGGEAIELYVDHRHAPLALFRDWTATHEFSHLMLPYVEARHRWISEGFAQYYQNVLLARSGTYDPLAAWQNLHDGFERGRRSRPELSPNEATERGKSSARMKIYWSGAAIALLADVALRARSGGEETLDDVLERLQACCLPSETAWSGPQLFATLDELAGGEIFMPLYRRYADTAGFPDTVAVFARLGLEVDGGRVRYGRGELADLRAGIMRTDAATAAWRQRLARAPAARGSGAPAGGR